MGAALNSCRRGDPPPPLLLSSPPSSPPLSSPPPPLISPVLGRERQRVFEYKGISPSSMLAVDQSADLRSVHTAAVSMMLTSVIITTLKQLSVSQHVIKLIEASTYI